MSHIFLDANWFTIEEGKQVRQRFTIRALVFNGNCCHAQCKIKHACTNDSCMKLNVFKFESQAQSVSNKVFGVRHASENIQLSQNYWVSVFFQTQHSTLESFHWAVNVLHRGEGIGFSNARLPWLQLPPSSLKCLFLSQMSTRFQHYSSALNRSIVQH